MRTLRIAVAVLLLGYLCCLPRRLFDAPYATVVTDRHGELLGARIAGDGQWRFPPGDTVPGKFERCIIAFEDRYFYFHIGVNPLATVRAMRQNAKAGRIVSGGSTITMQTVRLSRGKRRTAGEKLIEIILATRLECRYSKREILAMYASHAPFGGNVVGLEAAAWRYFGHSAGHLSWAEAATLAVLPNAPSMIHVARNRDRGEMDGVDYDLAVGETLPPAPLPLPQTAPHLVAGFHQRDAGKQLRSSVDKTLQQQVEAILDRWSASLQRSEIRHLAAIVIDVSANHVLAYCGNVHFERRSVAEQVDILRSPRSTGSILKPFLYCAALQEGCLLPHTLLPDIPVNINGFTPQNFNLQYEGAVPASDAVARSLNIPSVCLLREYGVPKFHDFLQKCGAATLPQPPSHYGLSLILGGAEATLWDISFVYSAMARSLLRLPRTAGRVTPDEPEVLPEIFAPGAVWQVFEALKRVNRPEEIDRRFISSMQQVAWKTGTSYGFRDAWAVGVTSRYVVGVWAGNASGEGRPELVGGRTAGPVMFDIFNILPSAPWFACPESEFVEASVCRLSGCLKGRFCDEVNRTLILPVGLRTDACPYHRHVNLSADGRAQVYENCIEAGTPVIAENRFVLPPAWEWYYKQRHPEYRVLPPFMKGCGEDARLPMAFIYPQGHARVYLPRQLDGSDGEITFELAHSRSDATVFWHIDTDYLGSTRDFHRYTFRPSRGRHRVTVVDDEGHSLSVGITVE